MLDSLIAPPVPAVILLLGGLGLALVVPRISTRGSVRRRFHEYAAAGVVGLALLSLLGLRVTYGRDSRGEGLELLSGWNFSTTESVAALVVRADALSLAFLVLILLVLLAVTLLRPVSATAYDDKETVSRQSAWLLMGASACLLFVSGNGLTLVYGVVLFDAITAFYWIWRGHQGIGVARLFLGILTAAGVMMAALIDDSGAASGLILLGLGLWLRLGLYPIVETTSRRRWQYDERLAYLCLTMVVGFYLATRLISAPLPWLVLWLVGFTMVLSGLLTWLVGSSAEGAQGKRLQLLVWLILTESLLIVAAGPLEVGPAIAFSVGLTLSLVALWVSPALGRPRLGEGAWSWPYLPSALATYTIAGLPMSLGWLARGAIYQSLFAAGNLAYVLVVMVAEALAFSGLIRYWLILWQGNEENSRRSTVGIVAMVPFLTPVLGPLILSVISRTDLSMAGSEQATAAWGVAAAVSVGAALGLDYFRDQIVDRLKIPVETLLEALQLHGLLLWGEARLNQVAKIVLRFRVTFEGRHYLGWAFFVALVGTLVILLR